MTSESTGDEVLLPDQNALASDLRLYVPTELPEREAEIERMKAHLNPALQGYSPDDLLVVGPPGQGKTAAVTLLTEHLRQIADVTKIYVDCSRCVTEVDVRIRLLSETRKTQHSQIPVGNLTGKETWLHKQFKNAVKEIGGVIVVIFDNFGLEEPPTNLLYDFSRFSVDDVNLSSIIITENAGFSQNISSAAKSSWRPSRVNFYQYNKEELVSILQRRTEIHDGSLENSSTHTLEYVAEQVVDEFSGSARAALDILRRVRSSSSKDGTIEKQEIQKMIDSYRNVSMMEEIGDADPPFKKVIVALANETSEANDQSPSIDEVYSTYCEVTEEAEVPQLGESAFRAEINNWIEIGILEESPDGITLGLEREFIERALSWHGGTVFNS